MKRKIILILFSGWVFENNLNAQIQFERSTEPLNGGDVVAQTVIQSNDGGYFTSGIAGTNLYVVKKDNAGAFQWSKVLAALSLGGMAEPNMSFPKGQACIQDVSGDYIVTGEVFNGLSATSSYDGFLMKINSAGTVLWQRIFGSTSGSGEFTSGIVETSDGGYAIAGYSQFGFSGKTEGYLVKFNGSGAIQWSKIFSDTMPGAKCVANNLSLTSDNGFIITGYDQTSLWPGQFNTDNGNIFLLKLSSNGLFQWSHCYGNTQLEEGWDVIQTSKGGYALTGSRYNYNAIGYHDAFLLSANSDGGIISGDSLWAVGITIDEDSRGFFVSQESDSVFVVAGSKQKFGGNAPIRGFLMKIKKKSNDVSILWNKLYGQPAGYSISADKTADGGFILGGEILMVLKEQYLIKTDSAGNSGCGGIPYMASLFSVFKDSVRSYNVLPVVSQSMNYNAAVLDSLSFDSVYCLVTSVAENGYEKTESVFVYPNPFSEFAMLKFSNPDNKSYDVIIYDVFGKPVVKKINNTSDIFIISRENLPGGIYFIRISTTGTNKIISSAKLIIR